MRKRKGKRNEFRGGCIGCRLGGGGVPSFSRIGVGDRVTGIGDRIEWGGSIQIIDRQFIWENPGRSMGGKGVECGRYTDQSCMDRPGMETCGWTLNLIVGLGDDVILYQRMERRWM